MNREPAGAPAPLTGIEIPPAPPADARHLLIGPTNSAGQGHAWANAVGEHLDGWTARSLYVRSPAAGLVFEADTTLEMARWRSPEVRAELARTEIGPAGHVLIETARPLVAAGVPRAEPSEHLETAEYRIADLHALVASGRRVGMVLHGSEVRAPDRHARLDPWSPFRSGVEAPYVERLQRRADQTLEILDEIDDLDVPVFVSTLDLLDAVPAAHWLPVCATAHRPAHPVLRGGPPVVAHLPSNPLLKGTHEVEPVLERLESAGLIRTAPHRAAPDEVETLLAGVDVLVDQIVLGNPGVLLVQALAAGCLVVAHLPDAVRRRFPEPPPVVEANPADLEDVLVDIARDPERYAAIATRGPAFAARYHDGRAAASSLAAHLLG